MAYHPFRNFGLKLVALSLAALLWVAVGGQDSAERYLRVPLEFQNVPAGLEIADEPPPAVDVRVRGSSRNLAQMQAGEVVTVIDMRAVRPGRRLFQVLPEQVRVPYGIDVIEVVPSSFSLSIERSTVRDVPIEPEITGQPAAGYVIGKVTVDPATVQISGPESRVGQLESAMTEPLSIERASRSVQERLAIGVEAPDVQLRGAREALVTVEIHPAPVERVFREVPIRATEVSPDVDVELTPATVSVTVRGTREVVAQLVPQQLEAEVDLKSLQTGRYTLPVRISSPADVGVTAIEPEQVEVRLQPAKDDQ